MKYIQPYWYLFAALLLFLPAIYKVHQVKSSIVEAEKINRELESVGRYIKSLKKYYDTPKKNRDILESLLKRIERKKGIKVDKRIKNKKGTFKIIGIKKSDLDIVVKEIFNSTMRVKKIKIDRKDVNQTRIEAEVIF